MKYGMFGIMMPLLVQKTAMTYLADIAPDIKASDIKKEFKGIIERQTDIGGRKNNLILGLYLAAYLLAVYKTCPQKITDEVFKGLVHTLCYSDIMRKMSEGKEFFTEKNMKTRERLAEDPVFNSYPENWKYTFSYDMKIPECTITYSECAICHMAKREGCAHLVKYMCVIDFANQELMGNKLIRTKTLANNDSCCDFHIIGKKRNP